MKFIQLSFVFLILAACQTTGSVSTGGVGKGEINVFVIPPEISRIVVPGVDAPRTVEIIKSGTQVVELARLNNGSVRYKTAPGRSLRPLNIKEFTAAIDGFIDGYDSVYRVQPTRINISGIGPGHFAVTVDTQELCLFFIGSYGKAKNFEGRTIYPGSLNIAICDPRQTLKTRPDFTKDTFNFIKKIVIRDRIDGLVLIAN